MPTTIAPRYGNPASGGLAPHQEPAHAVDAERSFSVKVLVRGVLQRASWTSPSHDVSVTPGARQTTIALVRPAAMDRDLVLEARSPAVSASQALVARDDGGWVVLASFRPDISDVNAEPEGRNVKIVVDCSGSMAGDSIAQVRIAGERILDGLRPVDRFDVVAFGSDQRILFGCETPATTANVARARRFVRGLDADMGGTEIEAALEVAYGIGGEGGMRHDLLLITDGEVWDAAPAVERARGSDHRIFTVGVGSSVAEPFVRALAEATGGACELVAPRADMGERIHRHFQRIGATPVRAARLHWPAPVRHVVPDPLPPPFPGDTMHLFGSFAERPRGAVVLEMELADGRTVRQRMEIDADPAETAAAQSDLARLGAARRARRRSPSAISFCASGPATWWCTFGRRPTRRPRCPTWSRSRRCRPPAGTASEPCMQTASRRRRAWSVRGSAPIPLRNRARHRLGGRPTIDRPPRRPNSLRN